MRLDHVHDRLEQARSNLQVVNSALLAVGYEPIPGKYIETQLSILDHLGRDKKAA
jgi:hypothetical protein